MKYKVFLVCGYRGTGKDTLWKHFSQHPTEFAWQVYANNFEELHLPKCTRLSFADALKHMVWRQHFSQPPDSLEQIDRFKHQPVKAWIEANRERYELVDEIPDYSTEITVRDVLINEGLRKRAENANYWVQKIIDKVAQAPTSHYMVTDWRFPNELEYLQQQLSHLFEIVTIRLFRVDVPIPDEVDSENALDDVQTEFLLVPRIQDFYGAIKRFSMYSEYKFVDLIF